MPCNLLNAARMGNLLTKGVTYEADNVTIKRCLFCDIAADKQGSRKTPIAYEDEQVRSERGDCFHVLNATQPLVPTPVDLTADRT